MNILIAEDDRDMQKILRMYLEREGYRVAVVQDGQAAVRYLAENPVDLALLDWMMPVQDGLSACREIRRLNIPVKILMLTARGQSEDELAGLSCGADDYLRKPFDVRVLILRIKKLCNAENTLRYRDLALNPDTMEAVKDGRRIGLTRTEFELLQVFMRNQRITLSRETLLDRVWGMDFEGDVRTVDTAIRRLRKKIGEDYIRTRVGMGYVMGDCRE